MSKFANLKQQRNARVSKSYALPSVSGGENSSSVVPAPDPALENDQDEEMVHTQPTGPISLDIDGLYAPLPPALDVRVNSAEDGNGRGIYSKFSRKPGDILFSVKPHVSALSNEHLEQYCSNCFAVGEGSLRRCTGCKTLLYCDAACQNADWTFHRHECTALQRWKTSASEDAVTIPGDAIRCLGRILWRKQKLGSNHTWSREIDNMQSHRTSLSKNPDAHDSQVHAQLAHAIVRFLGLNSPQELAEFGISSAAELVDLVSRFATNTFTISNPELAPLGACVSPLVALINHSCCPNAVVVFPRAGGKATKDQEPLMQVIAIKYIAPDEEILTAYIDTTLPREIRLRMLKETYHFTCRCRLCAPPVGSPVDWREAMWCPKKCGGVCPLPTEENSLVRCTKCGAPVKDTDAVLDAVRVGQEALHKAETLQFSDPPKSIQLTTKLIPILISAGLVPAAHPLLGLSRLNTTLLIAHLPSTIPDPKLEEINSPEIQATLPSSSFEESPQKRAQEALDEAIRAATRSSSGLSQILVEGHPVRAVALAELGKLLSVDEPLPTHLGPPGSPTNEDPRASPPQALAINSPSFKASTYPPSGPQRLKMAYETLIKARAELMIGFGGGKNEGGQVGQSVRKIAADLEKELSVWKESIRNVWMDRPKDVTKT